MAENRLGDGNVPIVLDGEEYILKPTNSAALGISRQYGGLRGALEQIVKMDLDAITNIIKLGLGPEAKNIKDLSDKILRAGLSDGEGALLGKCIDYIRILINGGRPLIDEDAEVNDDTRNPPKPR